MPTVRQETVLAYRADARGLQDLSRGLRQAFDPRTAQALNRSFKDLQKELKGLTAEQIKLTEQLGKLEKGTEAYQKMAEALKTVTDRTRQVQQAVKAGGPGPAEGSFRQGFAQGLAPGISTYLQRGPGMGRQLAGQYAGAGLRRGGMALGGAMSGGGFGALFQDIPFLSGLASMAQGAVSQAVGYQRSQLEANMRLGLSANQGIGGLGGAQGVFGAQLALSRPEALQMAAQAAGIIGGSGLTGGQAGALVQARRAGVGLETGAGFLRQQRAGRGGNVMGGLSTRDDREGALIRSIGQAMALGLRGSEVNEYMARLVSLQEAAAQEGVTLKPDTINNMTRAFGAFGMGGVQSTRLAAETLGAGRRIARQGATGPTSMAFLRAAGFDPSNPESYIDALMSLEHGLGPEQLFEAARNIGGGIQNPKQRGFVLQRAFQQQGINMGLPQAMKLAGTLSGPNARENFMEMYGGMGALSETADVKGAGAPSGTGLLQQQASVANTLLAVGQDIGQEVLQLQKIAADNAQSLVNVAEPLVKEGIPILQGLTSAIQDLTELIRSAEEGGAAGGLLLQILAPGIGGLTNIVK